MDALSRPRLWTLLHLSMPRTSEIVYTECRFLGVKKEIPGERLSLASSMSVVLAVVLVPWSLRANRRVRRLSVCCIASLGPEISLSVQKGAKYALVAHAST